MRSSLGSISINRINGISNNSDCLDKNNSLQKPENEMHNPLTLFRIVRGVFCLLVLISTSFMVLIFLASFTSVTLRLFSIHYSRRATSFLFGNWLAMWPLLFEKINRTKVIFSGDNVPPKERILLISNHRTEVDWMYIWSLALHKNSLGYIKYILKSSVRNVPIFGWGFHILEFILVERKWEVDKPVLESMLNTFSDQRDPLWLVLFPEGTDFTVEKCRRSQQFAVKNGLPKLENVLVPRTKGFSACLGILRDSLDAVYDVTIGYKYRCPGFMDNVFGLDPAEVHINIRRVPIDEIPASEEKIPGWLFETFQYKDDLLSTFYREGSFPSPTFVEQLPTVKCFINSALMIVLTAFFFYCATIFSWLKMYVILCCGYFAAATFLNFRPTPILGHLIQKSS